MASVPVAATVSAPSCATTRALRFGTGYRPIVRIDADGAADVVDDGLDLDVVAHDVQRHLVDNGLDVDIAEIIATITRDCTACSAERRERRPTAASPP